MTTATPARCSLVLIDEAESVLGRYPLVRLPIREETVIRKSIEFFDDPEPCFLHRSAVLQRLLAEIFDAFPQNGPSVGASIDWSAVPSHLRDSLDLPDPARIRRARMERNA